MLDNEQNKVDLFDAMNRGSIILINTAKDLLKQEGCEILGRFFIALIAQAVQERASLPEDKRLPTFVFIDEAQDYFDESIESLLNQGRKYKVGLIIAHQNLDQFSQKLRASVMASTSIKLVGGLSAKDTAAFAREMGCEEAFISERRKHQKHTEFACFIRNHQTRTVGSWRASGADGTGAAHEREGAGSDALSQPPAHLRGAAGCPLVGWPQGGGGGRAGGGEPAGDAVREVLFGHCNRTNFTGSDLEES